mmetsp:Transcript_37944/g.62957  ORF Transcript_37944/g.62957 Transcript_37944/m.62957 type:complete len:250 (+) Transcript_37944:2472-3221(+)
MSEKEKGPCIVSVFMLKSSMPAGFSVCRWCSDKGRIWYEASWAVLGDNFGRTNTWSVPYCPSTVRTLISMRFTDSVLRYVASNLVELSLSGLFLLTIAILASTSMSSTSTSHCSAANSIGQSSSSVKIQQALESKTNLSLILYSAETAIWSSLMRPYSAFCFFSFSFSFSMSCVTAWIFFSFRFFVSSAVLAAAALVVLDGISGGGASFWWFEKHKILPEYVDTAISSFWMLVMRPVSMLVMVSFRVVW